MSMEYQCMYYANVVFFETSILYVVHIWASVTLNKLCTHIWVYAQTAYIALI